MTESSPLARRGLLLLKLTLAGVLVWWLLRSGQLDFRPLGEVWQRWHWILGGVLACGCVQVLTVWRWTVLLRIQGIRYRFRDTFRICMIGLFFNQFLLGSVGGDLYKVFAVVRDHPQARSAGLVSVFVDRVTGLLMSLALVPVALFFTWDMVMADPWLASLVVGVVAVLLGSVVFGLCVVWLPLRRVKIVRWVLDALPMQATLQRVDAAIRVHAEFPREVLLVTIAGLLAQVFVVLTNVSLAFAIAPDLESVAVFFLIIPLALVAMALPINPPGALGTGEYLYQTLLSLGGFASGSLLSLMQRAVLIAWAIPGGVLYVAVRGSTGPVVLQNSESNPQ